MITPAAVGCKRMIGSYYHDRSRMALFRDDPSDRERLDWRLLHNGPITLYWREEVVDEDRAWLAHHGYRIYRFDASSWDAAAFHREAQRVLGFPEYYGKNLDAFNDCLSDFSIPDDTGAVLEFTHFDAFARRDLQVAHAVLDIIATNARRFLLSGRRLLALVQSDDPEIEFTPVGASPVMWNPREWLRASRC